MTLSDYAYIGETWESICADEGLTEPYPPANWYMPTDTTVQGEVFNGANAQAIAADLDALYEVNADGSATFCIEGVGVVTRYTVQVNGAIMTDGEGDLVAWTAEQFAEMYE
jgi:hypothetical protein